MAQEITFYQNDLVMEVNMGDQVETSNTVDFDNLDEQDPPLAADVVLIGDSENSFNLKKATIENLLTAQ